MAEVVREKSRGLKFAEQQLLRHGWEHGKGLGRAGNGISEAIKVKVKCDKGGVGHKAGEHFSFHWWDHVFNKASSSLQVESDPSGIKLRKTAEEEDGMISNKKPRKATLAKEKLYGCFVKSATLLSGQEQPEPKDSSTSDDSSSSDSEEEDERLDLSSTSRGARHGVTMSAKLARLEQQEAEFMAKYGKKSQTGSASPVCVTPSPPTSQEDTTEDCRRKSAKKKRSAGSVNDNVATESPETDVQPKKKKKRRAEEDAEGRTDGGLICVENGEEERCEKAKRKHKKKKNRVEQSGDEEGDSQSNCQPHADAKVKKKKKKSSEDREPAEDKVSDLTAREEVRETRVKQRRKKCKKDKTSGDSDVDEVIPLKKKKNCKDQTFKNNPQHVH